MTIYEDRLIDAAMGLRGANPEGWDKFVHAMREYSASVTQDLLRSPADDLVRNQGKAIGLTQLAMLMHKAPETYQKNLEKLIHGRPTRADSRREVWAEAPETDSGSG